MNWKGLTLSCVTVAGAFSWPATALADPIEDRIAALEEKLPFEFGGMAYGSYQYNFNEPDSRANSIRSLDPRHNSFTFDLFQLEINAEGPEGLSFGSKLDVGKTASLIASDWNGDGALDNSEETNDFEVQEAYLVYGPEWMRGLSVKAGKFVTLLGAEVIEAPNNPNFTRSFLFGFAIPFTHTGVLFDYPLTDIVNLTAGVVNGWDNVVDNNDGKTFLGSLALAPNEALFLSVNGVFGPEQTDTGSDPRGVVDVVGSFSADPFSLLLNFDYGSEGSAAADGGDATWTGFAGIVGFDLQGSGLPAGLFLRGEIFDDSDGARTGTEQTLWEITGTGKVYLTENLTLWLEYRHDQSDEDAFEESGSMLLVDGSSVPNVTDTQDTALVGLSYLF